MHNRWVASDLVLGCPLTILSALRRHQAPACGSRLAALNASYSLALSWLADIPVRLLSAALCASRLGGQRPSFYPAREVPVRSEWGGPSPSCRAFWITRIHRISWVIYVNVRRRTPCDGRAAESEKRLGRTVGRVRLSSEPEQWTDRIHTKLRAVHCWWSVVPAEGLNSGLAGFGHTFHLGA